MFACEIHHLCHFGLGDLVSEDAALADPVMVNVQHDFGCGLDVLLEEFLKNVDDELHRRVIVVQHENLVHGRLARLRPRLHHHAGVWSL